MTTPPTFSKKKPQKRNLVLSDGTKVATDNNKSPGIKKGKITKHDIPKEKFSTETGKTDADWEVADDLDSGPYPPPLRNPLFRKFWAESIGNVTERSNFQQSHLALLEALCMMRVELRSLDAFVAENGHTFRVISVLGEHRRTYPEVTERHRILSQLASYSRLLDLVPKKDKSKSISKEEEKEGWG